jgi:hypothetical protein
VILLSIPVIKAVAWEPPTPFEEVAMYVEQNFTDGDTEVVLTGTAGDDGLQTLAVKRPDGRLVLSLVSPRNQLGIREFHFESPEPPGEAVLEGYPEGRYVFIGSTTAGERLRSAIRFSHELPNPTTLIAPPDEGVVPAGGVTIQWTPVANAVQYILELENESADPEQSLTFNLPPSATSFEVPANLVVADAEYQVGIGAVNEFGNIVFVETTFSTAE